MNQNAFPERMSLEEAVRQAAIGEAVESAETFTGSIFEEIKRLAELSSVEYEHCRKVEAKRLNVRVSALDREVKAARGDAEQADDLGLFEPEPWPEEVDGDDLLNRIVGALCRHVVMPDHAPEAVALWCAHTFIFEAWQHTPRLAIGAPEKGCGKSTLLDVLSSLVPRGLLTDSMREAVAFRLAESHKPVFLIDECDTHLSSKNPDDGLRGILNSGHSKGKRALRCQGDEHAVKGFNTFTPVALAGIGSLPQTLADRSVRVTLQRCAPDEYVQPYRSDHNEHLRDLASQIARWVTDNKDALSSMDPIMPAGIYNRRADVWRPLVAIADVAGGDWPERARQAALALESTFDEIESVRVQLLGDIHTAFETHGDDKITSGKLAECLHDMEDRPWPEWRGGKPITVVQIARLLKPFGIRPGTIRYGAETAKGYKLSAFKKVFSTYTPQIDPSHRHNPQKTAENPENRSVTNGEDVTDQDRRKPAETLTCDGVTVQNGGSDTQTPFEGDSEEREAMQGIDGQAAICVQCRRSIKLDDETIPVAGKGEIHEHCYSDWFEASFGERPA